MKILCAKCFSPITDISKTVASCTSCGSQYILQQKATIFRVLLDGGYIKEGMDYEDIIKNIEQGNILPDEYIATYNGPWVAIFDSPFSKYIKKVEQDSYTKRRVSVFLYLKHKKKFIVITILSIFFILSLISNMILLLIINNMDKKISELIQRITAI